MIIVLMGVSGSGKSTTGKILARDLKWTFVEADDFHPAANIEKMRRGIPLDDADRRPWLDALRQRLAQAVEHGENVVLACSALKHSYQHDLAQVSPGAVHSVWLIGSEDLIRRRLSLRTGHFMNPALLHSQFDALEPPEGAVEIDIAPPPQDVATAIRRQLGL